SPFTKFTTPGGSTASTIRQSSATPSGSTGDGFTTTVLPHASAGPIFPAQFVIGKLKGVMQATTPTGSRTMTPAARERPVSRGGTPCSSGAVASSAARSSRPATARTCCASATARTAPVSAMVSSTRPSISPWNRSAAIRSNAARSPPLMVRHGPRSKASRAALAAASACATEQAGAWPAISSVAGFTTRSEEHTSELQSRGHVVCRLLLEKKETHQLLILGCVYHSSIAVRDLPSSPTRRSSDLDPKQRRALAAAHGPPRTTLEGVPRRARGRFGLRHRAGGRVAGDLLRRRVHDQIGRAHV